MPVTTATWTPRSGLRLRILLAKSPAVKLVRTSLLDAVEEIMPAQAKGVVHQPQSELEILQAAIGHLQGITNQMLEQRNQMKALELYRKLQPKSRSLWQDWAIGFWFSCSMRVNVNTKGIVKLRRKP